MEMIALILKLFLPLYDMYLKKVARDEQSIKDYNEFNEIMARRGLKAVQDRLAAIGQIDRVNEQWAKEDQNVGSH